MTGAVVTLPWRWQRGPAAALAATIAAFGPALHVGTYLSVGRGALVAVLAATAVLLGLFVLDLRWALRGVAVVAAVVPLGFVAGERVALWAGASVVLGLWSAGRLAPLPLLRASDWSLEPALTLSLLAAVAGYRSGVAWTAIGLTVVSVVITAALGSAGDRLAPRVLPVVHWHAAAAERDEPLGADPVVSWRQVPRVGLDVAAGRHCRSTRVLDALAPVLATAGPAVHTLVVSDVGEAVSVALTASAASVALGRIPGQEWFVRAALVLGAGLLVASAAGGWTAWWVVAALLLAEWGVRGTAPHPGLPASGAALGPTIIISLVAAFTGRHDGAPSRALLTTMLGLGAVWACSAFEPGWRRVLAVIGRTAWRVVSTVLFALLGGLVIVVPWAAHRLFRLDPVARRAPPGWSSRGRPDSLPGRLWAVDGVAASSTRWTRLRWALAVPVTVVMAAALAVGVQHRIGASVDGEAPSPPAIGDVDWWDEYNRELRWAFVGPSGSTNPQRFPPLRDVRGRYVNVIGGERRTWRPPECDCPQATLWIYGGSTVLGWGQRDDFTIPSELAKLAWDDGISLHVRNRGITGDLGWQAANRLAWDLSAESPPTVAVLYGGTNDLLAADSANEDRSRGYDPRWPPWWGDDSPSATFDSNWIVEQLLGRAPAGAGRVDTRVPPMLDDAVLGRAVAANYAAGTRAAVATASDLDVPVHLFWQPDRYTRPPQDGEPALTPGIEAPARVQREAAIGALPDWVHDLSGTFDDVPAAIYYDDVHTGERGAALVAAAIYDTIRGDLLAAGE